MSPWIRLSVLFLIESVISGKCLCSKWGKIKSYEILHVTFTIPERPQLFFQMNAGILHCSHTTKSLFSWIIIVVVSAALSNTITFWLPTCANQPLPNKIALNHFESFHSIFELRSSCTVWSALHSFRASQKCLHHQMENNNKMHQPQNFWFYCSICFISCTSGNSEKCYIVCVAHTAGRDNILIYRFCFARLPHGRTYYFSRSTVFLCFCL